MADHIAIVFKYSNTVKMTLSYQRRSYRSLREHAFFFVQCIVILVLPASLLIFHVCHGLVFGANNIDRKVLLVDLFAVSFLKKWMNNRLRCAMVV